MKRMVLAATVALTTLGCDRRASPTAPPQTSAQTPGSASAAIPPASPTNVAASASVDASEAANHGLRITFDADAIGGSPAGVEAVIGDWRVDERDGARGLLVDGSRWRNGTPSVNLADQARRLYGDRYAEFLDGVRTFAFFPLAVLRDEPPPGDIRMSVRFLPIAGQIDQAAGIAFGIQPDGSYQGVRANALEDNLLYFRVVRGRRTVLDTVRNVPAPTRTWHTLVVELRGSRLHVEVDGKGYFDKVLDAIPRGRVGLWSKADSQVLFDDFCIERLTP